MALNNREKRTNCVIAHLDKSHSSGLKEVRRCQTCCDLICKIKPFRHVFPFVNISPSNEVMKHRFVLLLCKNLNLSASCVTNNKRLLHFKIPNNCSPSCLISVCIRWENHPPQSHTFIYHCRVLFLDHLLEKYSEKINVRDIERPPLALTVVWGHIAI